MTISRADLDAGRVDLTHVIDPEAEPVGPIHPGYILHVDFMEPLGLSVYALAQALSVPRTRRTRSSTSGGRSPLIRRFGCPGISVRAPISGWGCRLNTIWRSRGVSWVIG